MSARTEGLVGLSSPGARRRASGELARPPAATLVLGALALVLAALPYAAGFLAAPRGSVFLGSLNNVGDTGQYLAALRQGTEGHLLYVNQYTSLRVAPILMYTLYTATGLVLAPLHLSVMAMYVIVHILAAAALLAALWHTARVALPERPLLAYVVALFGGGLYIVVLLCSRLAPLPFAPVALTAPEFSLFTTLLISPHGTLGLAAELWAFGGYLAWQRTGAVTGLIALAAGGLALGLCYPFGMVVLLSVVVADAAGRRVWPRRHPGDVWPLALALLPTCGVALYYVLLFRYDPLWSASNMLRLPAPGLAVLLAAFGPLLALAIPAALRLQAGDDVGRLLVAWAAVVPLLLLPPVPQAERLLSGWSVALALLGARTLARLRPRMAYRLVVALCCSNVMLALLYVAVALGGSNPAYYAPLDEVAAVRWLAAHCGPHDVVMASAGSGNLIVSAARCRTVVGQNFETFNWAQAQQDVLRYYAATTGAPERAMIVRRQHVTLVLAGPYERGLGPFVPRGPGYRLLQVEGTLRIFAVESR